MVGNTGLTFEDQLRGMEMDWRAGKCTTKADKCLQSKIVPVKH